MGDQFSQFDESRPKAISISFITPFFQAGKNSEAHVTLSEWGSYRHLFVWMSVYVFPQVFWSEFIVDHLQEKGLKYWKTLSH